MSQKENTMHYHRSREEHSDSRCSGRRGHGGHGRSKGFGFGGRGGRGGSAFRIGKMLADGDLRLIVLALLADQPRHGYDIIKAMEERSSGFYSPSPGIVYPTLTFLEEAGYAEATSEGNKKTYAITEAGRAHLEENRELVDTVLSGIEKIGRRMARARDWFEGSGRRDEEGGTDRDIPGVVPEVNEARRALKRAIAEKLDASADEQRRVASILREAASAIRKPGPDEPDDAIDLG
jgi:DNA-binding PadR family transcriptional regulator